MRKLDICICENKDADQLRGNREADQRLCFRYTDNTIPLLPKSEFSSQQAIFCGCTARFVPDLVGNPEDRFSHNEAHIVPTHKFQISRQQTANGSTFRKHAYAIFCDISQL